MAERNQSLDLLRTAAALAVVTLHVSAAAMTIPGVARLEWWTANAFHAASGWAVPMFVLVSGSLLLAPGREDSTRRFLRRRAQRLLVPLVFWSAVYVGASIELGDYRPDEIWLFLLFGVPSPHLWYLYMIAGLYLITPVLRQYLAQATPGGILYFTVLALALAAAASLVRSLLNLPGPIAPVSFLPFVGYYLAGRMLTPSGTGGAQSPRPLLAGLIIIAAFILTVLGTAGLDRAKASGWKALCEPLSPTSIAMGICIFILFTRGPGPRRPLIRDLRARLARLAPYTLGVYCLHFLIFRLFQRLAGTEHLTPHAWIKIPALTIAIFIVSAAAVCLIARVPYLRRVVI